MIARGVFTGLLVIGLLGTMLVWAASSDASERSVPGPGWLVGWANADGTRYAVHAALGSTLDQLGGSPSKAALQWVKAAAHVRSQAELRRAAAGIATARQQGGPGIDAVLCPQAAHGAPSVQVALALGGVPCAAQFFVRAHVPDGSPIEYGSRPPIGGPHYAGWYPTYGLSQSAVPVGLWLHNLERGAVVLLYNCPDQCPGLVERLQALYAALPRARDARSGAPRLLITAYRDMDRRIAVVAWGHLLELDELDTDAISRFYLDHVDRGPECRDLLCPQ